VSYFDEKREKDEEQSQDNDGTKKGDSLHPVQKEGIGGRDTERIDNQQVSMQSPLGSVRESQHAGTGEIIDPKSTSNIGYRDMGANGSNPGPTSAREGVKSGSFLHFAQSLMRRHHSDRKKDEETCRAGNDPIDSDTDR